MATLYVASDRPRAGRTALCVTLARHLAQDCRRVATFKPFHSPANDGDSDPDAAILAAAAGATAPGAAWPIALLQGEEPDVARAMRAYGEATTGADVAIVEGLSGLKGATGEASGRLAHEMGRQRGRGHRLRRWHRRGGGHGSPAAVRRQTGRRGHQRRDKVQIPRRERAGLCQASRRRAPGCWPQSRRSVGCWASLQARSPITWEAAS